MTDYGHDLTFGAFITPSSAEPQQAVALARHAERVGLDLVAFQDHPYLPRFLDTWTLLSYVAGSTNRIRLAPCVLNLPLRPPAMIARGAASLDLLSGGRLELGLGAGAGAFADRMSAMSAPARTPGESVDALAEAVAIIRALWDTECADDARFAGRFYRLDGAKRGPTPAHEIAIWLGAYQRRMLRMTGRIADGWLPSSDYLPPERLAAAMAEIDDAAEQAGRDPAAIRRLYNVSGRLGAADGGFLHGPLAKWVDDLTSLTLEHGISCYILGTDDPAMIDRFAGDVAPAVRAAVAAEVTPRFPVASRGGAATAH